jgi:hypothetical protein
MSKDEITVKFNITSGPESGKLLELQFPKTTKINDFVGNQRIRYYTPRKYNAKICL